MYNNVIVFLSHDKSILFKSAAQETGWPFHELYEKLHSILDSAGVF